MTNAARLLSIDELLRDRLPIGRTLLYEQIRAGRLGVVRIGRRTFVSEQALEEFINGLPSGGACEGQVKAR